MYGKGAPSWAPQKGGEKGAYGGKGGFDRGASPPPAKGGQEKGGWGAYSKGQEEKGWGKGDRGQESAGGWGAYSKGQEESGGWKGGQESQGGWGGQSKGGDKGQEKGGWGQESQAKGGWGAKGGDKGGDKGWGGKGDKGQEKGWGKEKGGKGEKGAYGAPPPAPSSAKGKGGAPAPPPARQAVGDDWKAPSWGGSSSSSWGGGGGWKEEEPQQARGSWGQQSWKEPGQVGQVWKEDPWSEEAPQPKGGAKGAKGASKGKLLPQAARPDPAQQAQQRQAELQKKKEEETKRTQQLAATTVRKVIQRLRVVQPDNFDTVRMELETALQEQFEKMGPLGEKVQQECEKELLEAQARTDALVAKRAEAELKKLEEEAKRKAEDEKIAKLKKDVQTLCLDAEEKLAYTTAANTRLEEALKDTDNHAGILKAASALSDLVDVMKKALEELSKALLSNFADAELTPEGLRRLKADLKPMQTTCTEHKKTVAKLARAGNEVKNRESRRLAAVELGDRQKAEFAKFAKKGALGEADIKRFAKEVYDFAAEPALVKRIHSKLSVEGGVPFEKFRRVRAMIGIERSLVKERARLAEVARLKAEVDEAKAKLKALYGEADKALEEAGAAAAAAEVATRPLLQKSAAALAASELREHAAKVEEQAALGAAALERGRELAKSAEAEAEAMDCQQEEATKLKKVLADGFKTRSTKIQARLDKSSGVAKTSMGKVLRKEFSEGEDIRFKIVKDLGGYLEEKSVEPAKLHAHIADGGALTSEKFVAFAKAVYERASEAVSEATEASFAQFFRHAAGDAEALSEERLTELLTLAYSVVKPTLFTEGDTIDSKAKRRLEEGETVHALGYPKSDGKGVLRVLCKAAKDDVEGWVSVAGNKGTPILEPHRRYMVSLKETVVTKDLDVSSETLRKLSKDELLEIIQFPTKEPSAALMRVKARMVSDGAEGWVSVANTKGGAFLGPC